MSVLLFHTQLSIEKPGRHAEAFGDHRPKLFRIFCRDYHDIATDFVLEIIGCPHGHNQAFIEYQYAITAIRLVDQMCGQKNRYPLLVTEFLEIEPKVATGARIKTYRRLIENQQLGPVQ